MITPSVPTIPAPIAALIMFAGLGLIYFALSGLGLVRSTSAVGNATVGTIPKSGSVPGSSSGTGGGASGGF